MRFHITAVLASIVAIVAAQTANGPNYFNVPANGYLLNAGQPTTFTWSNKQGSTVTLTLRDGPNGDLNGGTVIAANIPNDGTYTWNVPSSIVEGNSYTIEISDDDDPSLTNYTPQFDILSPNKATPTGTAASTSGAASSTASDSASTSSGASASASAATTSGASSSGAASTTGSSPSSTTASASTSSPTSDSAANMLRVGGGSLLAVAFGFAVAL